MVKRFIYLNGELVGVSNGTLTLRQAEHSAVTPLILRHHYSHKTTKNRFASFLIFRTGDSDRAGAGAIQLGYGIRPKMKHTVSALITSDNYYEFDRMWLHDDLPKNSESQVIALLLSYIKAKWPQIHFVVTYADGSVGNVGTIYKATNALQIGKSVVDFYVLPPTPEYPEGERVHPVTMWHRYKTRRAEVLEKLFPGYKRVKGTAKDGPFQFKFLYILNRGTRKAYEREHVADATTDAATDAVESSRASGEVSNLAGQVRFQHTA